MKREATLLKRLQPSDGVFTISLSTLSITENGMFKKQINNKR